MINEYVLKWLDKANKDLKVAFNELNLDTEEMVTEAICFHAQQAAEKYLKAYLINAGIQFDKSHNIEYLKKLCALDDSDFECIDTGNLTAYAVSIRYPDGFYVPDFEEAQESYKIAVQIKNFVMKKLKANN